MPRVARKDGPKGGRIAIPFDNNAQLEEIQHFVRQHKTALRQTAFYKRESAQDPYTRLARGSDLYGFEIKQRNKNKP